MAGVPWGVPGQAAGTMIERRPTRPWTRLNPTVVVQQLRASHGPGDEELAEQAVAHLRKALMNGTYVALEDGSGHTFVGTEAETWEHMMAHGGQTSH